MYNVSNALCVAQARQEIIITMPDGAERKGTSWETSPMDIAKEISKSLSERLVIAKACSFLWRDALDSELGANLACRLTASFGILSVRSKEAANLSSSTLSTLRVCDIFFHRLISE